MTEAFANLDLQRLETVYAPDCLYLSRERENAIAIGRASFWPMFTTLFDEKKKQTEWIRFTFRIVGRTIMTGAIHDVGYYRRMDIGPNGPKVRGHGKFSALLMPTGDGPWSFKYDGDVPASIDAYDQAEQIAGAVFDD